MADTVQLRCTTTDGQTASFAQVIAAVYAGVADPDHYRVELTGIADPLRRAPAGNRLRPCCPASGD